MTYRPLPILQKHIYTIYNIRSKFFQIVEVALVKLYTWLTIILLLFVTRCLKLYKLFRQISLKLITLFATNIPLALQVLSYFIILLKAWLYPTCSFLTVPSYIGSISGSNT